MSQTELAGTIGLTFQQIQKYEGGKNRISAGHLYQFACALECSPMDFYEGLEQHGNDTSEQPTDLAVRISKALAGVDDKWGRAILAFVRSLSEPLPKGAVQKRAEHQAKRK